MKIIRSIFLVVLLFGIGYFLFKVGSDKDKFVPTLITVDSVYKFPNVRGPLDSTVIAPTHRTSWKKYADGESYGVAILLMDTNDNSNWLGLVHTFKSFGIPFRIYTNVDSALKHDVVYVYPFINGSMDRTALAKLTRFPQKGGTLIAQCVEGVLNPVFGFTSMITTNKNFSARIADTTNPILQEFTDRKEREIMFADYEIFKESEGTYGYSGLMGKPLMVYPNGQAFLTERDFPGGGKAYAFGINIGYYALVCEGGRTMQAWRSYVNSYEPSLDVLIRIIKNIYTSSSKTAVTLGTVPNNKRLTVCITHDIDYSRSMINSMDYAKLEKSKNVTATYFIQTKYIKDYNDDDFYNDSAVGILRFLDSAKMEIASHSVSHSLQYDVFPLGKGNERYPSYHPVVKSKTLTTGGTVLGELRVSKFLLENFIKNQPIVSFRPGYLRYPPSLPQALLATGYKYGSDLTANSVLTQLPYQLNYDNSYDEELPVFEFPITIEDIQPPDMDKRLDSALAVAHKISKYGGFWCTLIHPDILGFKYKFEEEFIDNIHDIAYICSMREFADWWVMRNNVHYFVRKNANGYELHINTPVAIDNLTFFVPAEWNCTSTSLTIKQTGNAVLVKNVTNGMTINFASK